MLQMFFPNFVVDEDIIQIYDLKRIGEWLENIIHYPHEGCWSIRQIEMHDQPLKKTLLIFEGSLLEIDLIS